MKVNLKFVELGRWAWDRKEIKVELDGPPAPVETLTQGIKKLMLAEAGWTEE